MNILSTIFDMSLLIFKSCQNFCQLLPCASFKLQRFIKQKTSGILSRIDLGHGGIKVILVLGFIIYGST